LFPGENQSAHLAANQIIQIPRQDWIVFDEQEGTEKMWMVWAVASVPQLEAAKAFAQAQDGGAIREPGRIQAVRAFLDKYGVVTPVVEKDEVNKKTNVRGASDILVKLTKLEHH
jgi:hypothetical protein